MMAVSTSRASRTERCIQSGYARKTPSATAIGHLPGHQPRSYRVLRPLRLLRLRRQLQRPRRYQGGVTVTTQRSVDGTSVDVSWTRFTLSGFNYYRFVICRDTDYDGSSCRNNVYSGSPIYNIDDLGPVIVTDLDPAASYGLILQAWHSNYSSVYKYHATIPATP